MAKQKLQFYAFGTAAHEQAERVASFRESASASTLDAAIEQAQAALGVIDKTLDRENMGDPRIKELMMVLATVKGKALGVSASPVAESTRPKIAYLFGMAD